MLPSVQIPLPRKGTETSWHSRSKPSAGVSFKFHYPARGRKHIKALELHAASVQIPLPRKGTETVQWNATLSLSNARSNSITPQGDGNINFVPLPSAMERNVQIPLPRKGTETCYMRVVPAMSRVQIPLPRKGTETSRALGEGSELPFKFHYPARGRKPCTCNRYTYKCHPCSNSITPQGDGNAHINGTANCVVRFKFHYPARGRKQIN